MSKGNLIIFRGGNMAKKKSLLTTSYWLAGVGGAVHLLEPFGVDLLGGISTALGSNIALIAQGVVGVATIYVVWAYLTSRR